MNKYLQPSKKFYRALLVTIIMTSAVMSCTNVSSSNVGGSLPFWLASLIDKPKCAPPCWENLTPGVSNIIEAEKIIDDRPDTENLNQGAGPLSKNQKVLYWYFVNSGGRGEIYTDLNGLLISTIILHPKRVLTLEEAISEFEIPDEITLVSCMSEDGPVCEVRLLYLKKGFAIKFSTIPIYENTSITNFSVDVQPENDVTEIMFFQPGGDGYIQATKNKIMDSMERKQKWNGFGKYVFSYQ